MASVSLDFKITINFRNKLNVLNEIMEALLLRHFMLN